MKINDILQFTAPLISIATIVWQISEMKSSIYKYIDSALATRDDRLNQIERDIAVGQNMFQERKEFLDYQLHALREVDSHIKQRLMEEIKKLHKSSFDGDRA